MKNTLKFRVYNKRSFSYENSDILLNQHGDFINLNFLCNNSLYKNKSYVLELCSFMKDCQKHLIYENDVLESRKTSYKYKVAFEKGCFLLKTYKDRHLIKTDCFINCKDVFSDLYIVRNTHNAPFG